MQTQCSQPGPPFTQYKGPVGTCLMHPSMLRFSRDPGGPTSQTPDPLPLPQHSHVIEGTSYAARWWNAVGEGARLTVARVLAPGPELMKPRDR